MFCCACSLRLCSVFPMLSVSTEWLVTMSPLLCERSAGSLGRWSQPSVLLESHYSQNICSLPASPSAFSNHNKLLMTERRGETPVALVTGETWGLHWVSVHRMNRCPAWQKTVVLFSVVYEIAFHIHPQMFLKMQNYDIDFNNLAYWILLCYNVKIIISLYRPIFPYCVWF